MEAILPGDPNAIRAEKVLVNRIICTIGAYAAEMGGLDAIVFTGGIGRTLRRYGGMFCRTWAVWESISTMPSTGNAER